MSMRTAVDPGATGGAGIAGDAHIPPSEDDVRLQPAAGGEAPSSDTSTDAPHSRRETAGPTDSMTEIEQAVIDALLPATGSGQPPFPFPFELGPSMLLSDRSGIRAQWSLTPAEGQAPGTGRHMRTLFQAVLGRLWRCVDFPAEVAEASVSSDARACALKRVRGGATACCCSHVMARWSRSPKWTSDGAPPMRWMNERCTMFSPAVYGPDFRMRCNHVGCSVRAAEEDAEIFHALALHVCVLY
eukprot:COSAG02_NODE_4107_length_5769_cov_7.499471_4_plen_243_part_00